MKGQVILLNQGELNLSSPSEQQLTQQQFLGLTDVPPEREWFANIRNPNTKRAYKNDLNEFKALINSRIRSTEIPICSFDLTGVGFLPDLQG